MQVILFGLLLLAGCGKKKAPEGPTFSGAALVEGMATEQTARWLIGSDITAWRSSDVVMTEPPGVLEQLGQEWFPLQHDDGWFAIYGRYDAAADAYTPALVYEMDPQGQITRAELPIDSDEAAALGRALYTVRSDLPGALAAYEQLPVNLNQYIRPSEDHIEVFLIPSLSPDAELVIGPCGRFELDAEGRTITAAEVWDPGGFAAVPMGPDQDALIPSPEEDVISVFEMYWMLYYADNFKSLGFETDAAIYMSADMGDSMRPVMRVEKPR